MIRIASYLLFLSLLIINVSCNKEDPEYIAAKDREKLLEYIAENELDAQEHEGIFYVVLREGTGEYPTVNSSVKMNYKGELLDGTVFDLNEGITMSLRNTIKGFQIGVPLFNIGAKGILLIPSGLGYGPTYQASIPMNSCLVFEIELIDMI